MTELRPILRRLGLEHYLDQLVAEGFETWETLCDITEADFHELDVKLGHRRQLQREIAISRGYGQQQALSPSGAHTFEGSNFENDEKGDSSRSGGQRGGVGPGGKRKYRRHPKPDENAPDRAPSAYVIFSNRVREDLKSQNLSFTDIAKRVGEQWQVLRTTIKATYESQASIAKEKYRADLQEYKKTSNYQAYTDYLADFKRKNNITPQTDEKRPRLEKEASLQSSHSAGSLEDANDDKLSDPAFGWPRPRANSFGSMATETTSELPSPSAPYVPKPFPVVGVAASSNGLPTRKQPFSSHTPTPSQLQLSSDGSQVRAGSLDSSQARSSAFAAGPDMLTAKSSLLAMHMARQESKSSTSSLTSSNILTNVATAPSSLGSLTSDQRAQRTLPPISSLGLETRDSPGRSPGLTAQSVPFLKPSFSTSDSSTSSSGRTASTSQLGQSIRADNRLHNDAPAVDDEPARPSFRGEYDTNAFSTDPLSVLAYAGRMVDRDDRGRRTSSQEV